jgi:hypothetical protein
MVRPFLTDGTPPTMTPQQAEAASDALLHAERAQATDRKNAGARRVSRLLRVPGLDHLAPWEQAQCASEARAKGLRGQRRLWPWVLASDGLVIVSILIPLLAPLLGLPAPGLAWSWAGVLLGAVALGTLRVLGQRAEMTRWLADSPAA